MLLSLSRHKCKGGVSTAYFNISDFERSLSVGITACESQLPLLQNIVTKYFFNTNQAVADLKTKMQSLDTNSSEYKRYANYVSILERQDQSTQYNIIDMANVRLAS
jgi:hypothetical protein